MMELKKKEEIIKALECHASGKLVECEQCPLDKAHLFNATCVQAMCDNALALIKELTEEIKDLEAEYDRVYEQAEADIHGNMADGGTSCHWCIDRHRAESIKEFAERLKKRLYGKPSLFTQQRYIVDDEIDNLVKEMTEGKSDV